MIQKSSNIFYAFDFDGTLMGDNHWTTYIKSTMAAFKKGPYINPNQEYDIRWSVITGRPIIDKPVVWFACHSMGLHPEKIYTYPKMFHNYSYDDVIDYKVETMKKIIDTKIDGKPVINKLFYIDNDLDCIAKINTKKGNYPMLALSVIEFRKAEFNVMI